MFVENWKRVLRYAWSVRLITLAAMLSGLEVMLPMLEITAMPPGMFAALSGLVSAAALFARVVAQPVVSGDADAD